MSRLGMLLMLLFCFFAAQAQNSDSTRISIETPPSWFSGNKNLLRNNLLHYTFSGNQMRKLNREINATEVLGVYYKYDTLAHVGLIPTIKIYLHTNNEQNFDNFIAQRKEGFRYIRSRVSNFRFVKQPEVTIISGQKALYTVVQYELPVQTGATAYIRTRILLLPLSEKYLEITMMDNEQEDCTEVYEQVIRSLHIR